ncbi:AsmA family protein [Xylophilus rhododendri]|uniref:AsmA family protein n=1 Tax=Xylophilus rhododendri TaxID=2697032 RepID=A0A857J131_9BURK|nr:AsmA family protein [Xylophilus rhododendri]QHI96889.1 AsmA family protein [Xylophilus rhododendri]
MTPAAAPKSFPRRHPVAIGIAVALVLLVLLFDWNWFRHPLERYISKKTERTFTISDLHVKLGLTPTIRMRDVVFGNAKWSKEPHMASIPELEFSVSLRDLPEKVLIPRVALTKPDLLFERLADDRKNWILSDPNDKSPSKLRISTLSVDNGHLRYTDAGTPFNIDVLASTFDPSKQERVKDADAKPVNDRYSTRFEFHGGYRDAKFKGTALTGEVLSFQESGVPFPLKGELDAGTTRLEVEGTIADAANISGIDTRLMIKGQTLANLYPFLLLPLPATPPYQLQGHLILKGDRYSIDDLVGKIGSSDVHGSGAYVDRKPRPLLTADLHSKLLDISDLGPVVGVQTAETGGKPDATQAKTADRPTAKTQEKQADPNHILPSGTFDGSRLQKIDADVSLEAAQLKAPTSLPLESLKATLHLQDAVMKLAPLDFGFAGGTISSHWNLDARKPVISTEAQVDFRHIQVAKLVPASAEKIAQGAGTLGARIKIKGTGNSIADAAAKADGEVSAAIANGRISNLIDAASGLNGGKVLALLAGGDKTIEVNCGGLAFDVKDGKGTAKLFVVDTEQTQILGTGGFDLAQETFNMEIAPKPKRPGILSLRTPVKVFGTFKNPDYSLEKGPLLARAGGAVALAVVAPLAAVLPLIETGPGENTNCARVSAEAGTAEKQAVATPAGAQRKNKQ